MMSVSYTLLTVVVATATAAAVTGAVVWFVTAAAAVAAATCCCFSASSADDCAAAASWVSEPEMGAAALMDRPIFSSRLPSLPVFFSCNRSGGGCDRCNCCNRMYCSCNAFCFFSSSWCRCSSCSCLVAVMGCCCCCCGCCGCGCCTVTAGGSGIGGLPEPPTPEAAIVPTVEVSDPFRLGGLSAAVAADDDDDTDPLGDAIAHPGPAPVVGDATGDLELVRGGGGGGILLFCRSGVRSGTGGLPASDDVLLNRRRTGFGAVTVNAAVTAAAAPAAVVFASPTAAAAAVAVVSVAVVAVDGVVWSSPSRVSSAFSAPVGSQFPSPPSVPVPVWSTTLPCLVTLPWKKKNEKSRY